ncbi:hypothetical protein MXAN_1538 [Myxococcus xanthus DK 1622]|uniref:Uncharacterized protein n=1 Tax=Myxococcus xanthus (strain DK1622) TaxID=246197 RepID=Q1DC32_MYXXD|nr:hypothetical protein MXAN_1538 [Myxococcus xanthus DK 1622]
MRRSFRAPVGTWSAAVGKPPFVTDVTVPSHERHRPAFTRNSPRPVMLTSALALVSGAARGRGRPESSASASSSSARAGEVGGSSFARTLPASFSEMAYSSVATCSPPSAGVRLASFTRLLRSGWPAWNWGPSASMRISSVPSDHTSPVPTGSLGSSRTRVAVLRVAPCKPSSTKPRSLSVAVSASTLLPTGTTRRR